MEELLARERASKQHVQELLKDTARPDERLLKAFEELREASGALVFADFENGGATKEQALWAWHSEAKKSFNRELGKLRKQSTEPVELRRFEKLYLQFIKDSQRYYRAYVHQLNITFGGIPELEEVAHQVKNDSMSESSQSHVSLELRKKVLESCHQTLIRLGDLSRYRASEKLDKNPDFGPAIGFYELACTLRPESGMGQHQLAVVALDQKQHLRAIYYLYRAMVVDEPHPNAATNLRLEFNKINVAWERNELIQKGLPNDPESSKQMLAGWFVRLHSMCYKGEPFRGYDELEREILGQLTTMTKQRSLDNLFMRMIMVNLAAQYNSGESFQKNPTEQNQTAFLHFFRFNVKTFTALLRVFYDDLRTADVGPAEGDDEVQLATRLTDVVRRVLPAIRLYSSWLLASFQLVDGLAAEEFTKDAIDQFWRIYAKAIDLVATVFPIWDLEELPKITYLLEEDVDSLSFKPLIDEKTKKIWYDKQTGMRKARFSDHGIQQASADEETLGRVTNFLEDGLYLANDEEQAPIKLRGTRILHRDAEDVEPISFIKPLQPTVPTSHGIEQNSKPPAKPKPMTYAAAAANGPTKAAARVKPNGISSTSQSRHAQLSRMVDDLVDDDDGNNPITPPQQHSASPAVVANSDVTYSALPGSTQDFAQIPNYPLQPKQKPIGTPTVSPSPPHMVHTPRNSVLTNTATERLNTVSSRWNGTPSQPQSAVMSSFPAGLPTGTLSSPAQLYSRGHSRVNSASSIRSRASQNMNMNLGIADSWSSIDSAAPKSAAALTAATGFGNRLSGEFEQPNMASPLLFGAGGGLWSTSAAGGPAFKAVTPPNAHTHTPSG